MGKAVQRDVLCCNTLYTCTFVCWLVCLFMEAYYSISIAIMVLRLVHSARDTLIFWHANSIYLWPFSDTRHCYYV